MGESVSEFETVQESSFDVKTITAGTPNWRYKITPTYDDETTLQECEEIFIYSPTLTLGRRELATLWWKHCPNQCETHERRRRSSCRQFCKPLCENVGVLSRQLLKATGRLLEPHQNCRFPELVRLTPLHETKGNHQASAFTFARSYKLSIGTDTQIWMRFRVVVECNSPVLLSSGSEPTIYATMNPEISTATILKSTNRERKRPVAVSASASPPEKTLQQIDLDSTRKTTAVNQLITPATTKTRRTETKDDSSSICRRRLFDTKSQNSTDDVEAPGGGKHLKRLFSSDSPVSSSFLSLPMPHEGSQLSTSSNESSLQEATQIQWPSANEQVSAKSLSLADWKSMQNGKGIFCTAMADLIVERNAKNAPTGDQPLWLPSLLSNANITGMNNISE